MLGTFPSRCLTNSLLAGGDSYAAATDRLRRYGSVSSPPV